MKIITLILLINGAYAASHVSELTGKKWEAHLKAAEDSWNQGPYDFKPRSAAESKAAIEAHKRIIKEMEQKKEKVK